MTRFGAALVAAMLTGAVPAAALHQSPQQRPARDLRVETVGEGVIGGVVRSDGAEGRPLRRASVELRSGALMTGRRTFTSSDGAFEFRGLPPGQYNLTASYAAHMSAEYGARRPGGTGAAIALGAGQRLTDVVFRLSRYASIAGVVFDQNGEPVEGISVEAFRYTMRTGRRTLSKVYGQPSTTNDRGMYTFGGLAPGQYYIAAGPSPRNPIDVQVLSEGDIDRALQRVRSGSEANPVQAFAEPRKAFAPVFFPGTPDVSRAQVITVGLAEEKTGVNIRLELVPTARLEGTVVTPDGQPAPNAQVVATAVTEAFSMDLFDAAAAGSAPVDARGRFTFPALAPGRYVITARTAAVPGQPGGAPALGTQWAMVDVVASGDDFTLTLTLQPAMTISGRVMFNGSTAPPNPGAIRLDLSSAQSNAAVAMGVAGAAVDANGQFRFTGVTPGPYRITAAGLPAASGWMVRSAVVNGVDALDSALIVEPGRSIDDVVVTYTDKPTELSGSLQTPAGDPTADYFIIVFSADKTFWTPMSRRNVMTRPASSGAYVVRNLPPGEYFVAAVTDVEQGAWWDTEFLAELHNASPLRVTLADGEKKSLNLRVGR
jgi:protocatechuate 3,4-dioxygenase beta subunit